MTKVISTTEQKMNMFISEKGYDAKFVDLLFEIKEAYIKEQMEIEGLSDAYIAHDGILSEVVEQLAIVGKMHQ